MIFSLKLVARYRELKVQAPDCLLLMQVGAFIDVLDQDARAVAAVTGLKRQMAGEVDAPALGVVRKPTEHYRAFRSAHTRY